MFFSRLVQLYNNKRLLQTAHKNVNKLLTFSTFRGKLTIFLFVLLFLGAVRANK
mgnify:FL=1